jgi:hypothetical protein
MLLRVLSDASFLSRPNAGSVAGGLIYLGLTDNEDWVNHPISCHSTRIPVVCSFVTEAEYAGLYAAARIATEERKILANMGHPQPATPLFCDNEVAIGIAADTVSHQMSKATDMRLHWIRDRDIFASSSSGASATSPTSSPSLFLLPVIASWLHSSPPTLPTTTLL